jgi:hypothetical protein
MMIQIKTILRFRGDHDTELSLLLWEWIGDSIYRGALTAMSFRLPPDIIDWCEDNVVECLMDVVVPASANDVPAYISFNFPTTREAVAFKLRWL